MNSKKVLIVLESVLSEQDEKEVIKEYPNFGNTSAANKPPEMVFFRFATPEILNKFYSQINSKLRDKFPQGMTVLGNSKSIAIHKYGSKILMEILNSVGFKVIEKN